MRLGIDGSNLRAGGGVTHLVGLLRAADPTRQGFSQVIVWSGQMLLRRIEDRPWLVKRYQPILDRGLPHRLLWQRFYLSRLVQKAACDVLFVPGGFYGGRFHPFVTMSRNMLPFEWPELRRYGYSLTGLRLVFLRWGQLCTFRRADGLIFLTQYARQTITRVAPIPARSVAIIPHGTDDRFLTSPRLQLPVPQYSLERPFCILYVSTVDLYKHQWHVAEAIATLRKRGYPIVLDMVGPAYPPALKKLNVVLKRFDPEGTFLRYVGPARFEDLPTRYKGADMCIYASSCENMPNSLLEAMASGLPIACSDRGPMPEVLGDAGLYFDPECSESIADAVRTLFCSAQLRTHFANSSFERAQPFSWHRCAEETLEFLKQVATAQRTREPPDASTTL